MGDYSEIANLYRMRQSILILAHKNFDHLQRLVDYFRDDCDVFVHVDRKVVIPAESLASILSMPQVKGLYQAISVNWGGFSVLESEMLLFEHALQTSEASMFHLISGQDYPIKPLDAFLDFFQRHDDRDYIEYKPHPIRQWGDHFFDRYRYYFPCDVENKQLLSRDAYIWASVRRQAEKGWVRDPIQEYDTLYKGSQWMSLTRLSAQTVLDSIRQNPSFYNRLRDTFAPEETYPHTILLNSKRRAIILNNNLRYVRWLGENGNNPSNLGPEHFDEILKSDCFFARKMEKPYCVPLIQAIDSQILCR